MVEQSGCGGATESRRLGPFDRALKPFGDVRAGEGATALLMCLNVHLLLVAYYILKTVREPLILATGGAEVKSYAAGAQALALVFYVPAYGWLATRLRRERFLAVVVLFFVGCLQVFALSDKLGLPDLGFIFFVWVGVFNLTTIAQFWSYASEIYSRADGDRLFPVIAVGSAAGAPVGAALAEVLFRSGVGSLTMMQIAAAILLLHLALYRTVGRRVNALGDAPRPVPGKAANGFVLVARSRYLTLLAWFLVLLNICKTLGEYILGRSVLMTADARFMANPGFDREAFIGAFYGDFFFWTNVVTILVQAFLVSRLVKWFGIRGALLALPVVALGAYGIAAAGVGLGVLRYVKIAENAADYSVNNTVRQMLWLPTTWEEKYKAKQAIDTFFVRGGDVLAAGLVFLGTRCVALGTAGFARANIIVVLASIGVAGLLLREYNRLTKAPKTGVKWEPTATVALALERPARSARNILPANEGS